MASHMGRAVSKGAGIGTTLRISAARKVSPTIRLLRIVLLLCGRRRWGGLARCGRFGRGLVHTSVRFHRLAIEAQCRRNIAVTTFRTEYQQQIATAVELRGGFDPHLGKGLR